MRRATLALTALVVVVLVAAACSATEATSSVAGDEEPAPQIDSAPTQTPEQAEPGIESAPTETPEQAEPDVEATASPVEERQAIIVPLTLHVAVEEGDPDSELSSRRTIEEVTEIAANMADIWSQADVIFDPVNVNLLEIPRDVLVGISVGDTDPFFTQVNTTFVPQDARAINGFYIPFAFGVNGFAPTGSNIFFVVDEPSVNDERVSSHEVGHIFGLHHDLNDDTQLMFSGTNGTGLSEIEQTVSRYGIQNVFPQGIDP